MNAVLATLFVIAAFHDVHVSTARMMIRGNSAIVRVRLFHNDLEGALRQHTKRVDFVLAPSAQADSAFLDYAATRFVLGVGGKSLAVTVLGSGEEPDRDKQELNIWYYDLRFDAVERISTLDITNELLFERFRDQRNNIVVSLPNQPDRTINFVTGAGQYRLKITESP